MFHSPLDGRKRIIHCRREDMLRRQAIIHRKHHTVDVPAKEARQVFCAVQIADDPPAAVQEDEQGISCSFAGIVDPRRDLPGRPRDGQLPDGFHFFEDPADVLEQGKALVKIEPRLGRRDLIKGDFPQHHLPPAQQGSLLIQAAARERGKA